CVAVEGSGGGKGGRGGQLVILDAGTGIRALGRELVERQNGAVQAEILLSHAHWDHIQGLPHFKPFFAPGNAVRIWGSRQGTSWRSWGVWSCSFTTRCTRPRSWKSTGDGATRRSRKRWRWRAMRA